MIANSMFLLEIVILGLNTTLAIMAGYLLLLAVTAFYARGRQPAARGKLQTHFLILVPANNEEKVLPQLLDSLVGLDYPREQYAVYVVADNCTDMTAVTARRRGAVVHERLATGRQGKGPALNWLLARLKEDGVFGDAFLILDADSIVSPDFLRVMDARLEYGDRIIQSYYSVKDPEQSFPVALRYAALAVLHYLRPLGRTYLGGSAGLKGNGMVFATDLFDSIGWSAGLTEDIEFHMNLLLSDRRVAFAPDAVVWSEMPASLANTKSQNARWETGRLEMARRYVPLLLRSALVAAWNREFGKAFMFFDAAMEHVILPFSLLVVGSGLAFAASALLLAILTVFEGQNVFVQASPLLQKIAFINLLLSIVVLVAQLVYLLAGLSLDRAPRSVYRSLLFAPIYIAWKCWQIAGIMRGKQERLWVRTTRN